MMTSVSRRWKLLLSTSNLSLELRSRSFHRTTKTTEFVAGADFQSIDAVDADINRFRDVIIADGTVLRLHEFPEKYEARHEDAAGAKLHPAHNATDQTIERIDVTDEKNTR